MEWLMKKLGRLQATFANHSRKFGNANILSYTVAIVPRILFVLHAVFSVRLLEKYMRYEDIQSSSNLQLNVVWRPTSIRIEPIYIGLILLAFESLYTILVRKGHEYKHIWYSGFFYLTTQIPVICCIEYAFFQKRRAYYELATKQASSNQTILAYTKAPYFPDTYLNCFHFGVEFNCTEKFIKNFAELGLISVILIGRWMLPRGELTRDQLSALLIGYVNTAADLTEFIGLHSKDSLSREKTAIVSVLVLYCISLLQFVVITTSTTYEYSETEKEAIKSLSSTPSTINGQKYMHPLRAKLGRADMMRNIDALQRNAFKSGKRADQRRRGIRTAVNFENQSGQKEGRDQRKEKEAHITTMSSSNDFETNPNPGATANTIDTKMPESGQRRREDFEKLQIKEMNTRSGHKGISDRSEILKKWQNSFHASLRLDDIKRLIMEENWKQLSQTLKDMKVTKRIEAEKRWEESAVATVLKEYDQGDKYVKRVELEVDENQDEEDEFSSWHKWIEVVQTEMGGLLVALFLQEIPFFFTRVAFIYKYKVFDRGLIFYTTKNFFMLCFLNYRLWVATTEE